MNTRQTLVSLIAAVAVATSAGAAVAAPTSPVPEPQPVPAPYAPAASTEEVLRELRAEYAATRRNSTHNLIVLITNSPVSATT